ncbi:MAG: chromosomal replication initiator protein DnaA [Acidobacteriota bacterium]|nr:chromosomal replication initiator protein DnaA [Acidobacteriota bacterium]MDH3783885.1 chromosomal replication initiator protein DnaA [Acidobacteriota bacterium]
MQGGTQKNTWESVLGRIESQVSTHSFKTWFKPTKFHSESDEGLKVQVPNSWFAEWLKTNYGGLIEEALRKAQRPGLTVEFVPETLTVADTGRSRPADGPDTRAESQTVAGTKLNSRYSFQSFVVSSCNQFAHAASVAVAEQPARAYNPLYIYGGVGLGKTHLMQAIGNNVRLKQPGARLHYISSEIFMNELINAIRFEKTFEFKERYRNVDVLLIDDIQFLAGKERTQEEFFHTFNALYDSQKQIVITSDVMPREIPTLEERLRSRFEWGLIADIQPPDLETKVAILKKKAEKEQTEIPDDVNLFIAANCQSNIRELEGALNKVVAYASMSGRNVTLDLAKETLHDILPGESPATTVESIMKQVSQYYNMPVSQLKSKNNSQQVAFPRQVAMYLCKQLTSCSLPEIGRRFGGKHHSTVIHAVQKINRKRNDEKDFDRLVENFVQTLN